MSLAALPEVTAGDIVPGAVLSGRVSGSLRLVYKNDDDGDASTRLKFRISTKLAAPESDYVYQPGPSSPHAPRRVPFSIGITLAPKGNVEPGSARRLLKIKNPAITLNLTGTRVVSRVAKDSKLDVEIEGTSDMGAQIDDAYVVLLETKRDGGMDMDIDVSAQDQRTVPLAWDFHADLDDTAPPKPEIAQQQVAPTTTQVTHTNHNHNNHFLKRSVPSFSLSRSTSTTSTSRPLKPLSAFPQLAFTNATRTHPARQTEPVSVDVPTTPPPARIGFEARDNAVEERHGNTQFATSSAEAVDQFSESPATRRTPVDVDVTPRPSPLTREHRVQGATSCEASPSILRAPPIPLAPAFDSHSEMADRSEVDRLRQQVMEMQAQQREMLERMEAERREMRDEMRRLRAASARPDQQEKRRTEAPTPTAEPSKKQRKDKDPLPFREKDPNSNSRAEHAVIKEDIRKAPETRDAQFAQGVKLVQVESRKQGKAPERPPPTPAHSRAERQKEAEAVARTRAEQEARELAMQRQREQEAAAFEARSLTDEMANPFTVGGHRYTPLSQLRNHTTVNMMGVVIDPQDVKGGPPNDYHCNIVITDPSLQEERGAEDGRVITIFRKTAAELQSFDAGCPVLFRNVKISMFKEKPKGQLYGNALNELAVYRDNGVFRNAGAAGGGQVVIAPAEYQRLKLLKSWFTSKQGEIHVVHRAQGQSLATKKEKQLGEVRVGDFFDAALKVLLVQTNGRGGSYPALELYVTDGTVNPGITRNFHNVDAQVPPSAVFCLAVWRPLDFEFNINDCIFFPNMRCKLDRNGQLELNWSEMTLDHQRDAGWRDKVARKLQPNDPKVKDINERFKALKVAFKTGEPIEPMEPAAAAVVAAEPVMTATTSTPPVAKISTMIFTAYTDSINHPVTPIAEALADPTEPNKYRIQARVTRVEPVPNRAAAPEFAITYCTRCSAEFERDYCLSCNDMAYRFAEARYRMLVFLEIDAAAKRAALESFARARRQAPPTEIAYPDEVAVLLADAEAEFLPPLPDLHSGPNEIARARTTIRALRSKIEDLLLGNKWEGERTHPIIDWTVIKYRVEGVLPEPQAAGGGGRRKSRGASRASSVGGGGGPASGNGSAADSVMLWKVFGMTRKT